MGKPNLKFRTFINSFLVDTLIFIVTILTVFLVFVVLYIITGQPKLKTLVPTMALQRIRAVETLNTNRQTQNCNSELLKILMILNLVTVVSLLLRKIKKSVFFWGQPFSNMVKIKLFLADTKSNVSLDLNQLARNTHLFKLTGRAVIEQCHSKEN